MTTQEIAKFTQSLLSELPTDFDFEGSIGDLADRLHDWVANWTMAEGDYFWAADGEYFGRLTLNSLAYMHGEFDYNSLATFLNSCQK